MKKVIVFGTFDLFHEGHKHLLRQAKEHGDYLIVIVARDRTVLETKKILPIHNEEIRVRVVRDANLADYVRLGNRGHKHHVLREEKPDIIALGYDQKHFIDDLEKFGLPIVRLKPFKPKKYKSSLLKKRLK